MKKFSLGLLFFILLCSFNSAQAQYEYEPSRVYVGGSFGLQFGTEDIIDISPVVEFWITPFFTVGVGMTYQKYNTTINNFDYTDNVYGTKVFSRLYVMDQFYLHAEYEYLALEEIRSGSLIQKFNASNYLVGVGFREWIGPNIFTSATILWNLNNRYENGSNEPIYRVGIGVGL